MADYGAKVSVPGYDVGTVTDYLLQSSSSWPLLKIHAEGSATITLNATPQTIHTHSLDYRPFYIILSSGRFNSQAGQNGIGVSDSVLAYDGSSTIGGSFSFYYYICRLSLESNFTAPLITGGTSSTSTTNNDYGIKVAKPGKSVNSTDLRDFSLYSSARSLMVHKVDYGLSVKTGDFYRTVAHGLPYVPLAFSFVRGATTGTGHNPDYLYIAPPPIGVAPYHYTVDATNVQTYIGSAFAFSPPAVSTVILKDPFSKQTVSRTFP